MAIVRMGNSGSAGKSLDRRVGLKAAGKKAAKKAPAKKHPAKKHADKHPGKKAAKKAAKKATGADLMRAEEREARSGSHAMELASAFHHLQRAGSVISLLEHDSGGDLRMLLEHGIEFYRKSSEGGHKKRSVLTAHGLLRAAEHLGMAGLYSARSEYRAQVAPPPGKIVGDKLSKLEPRLDRLPPYEQDLGRRLDAIARELLRRAAEASHDPHLEYELVMAADGICCALEEGL